MKLLEQEEYETFVEQFHNVPTAVTEGKLLHEGMQIRGRELKIAVAWRHYSGAFEELWQRKYLEMPDFYPIAAASRNTTSELVSRQSSLNALRKMILRTSSQTSVFRKTSLI